MEKHVFSEKGDKEQSLPAHSVILHHSADQLQFMKTEYLLLYWV